MSMSYHAIPIPENQRTKYEGWLNQAITTSPGRAPTFPELKAVLATFPESALEYFEEEQRIEGGVTDEFEDTAWLYGWVEEDEQGQEGIYFYFKGSPEVAAQVVERLTHRCGTYLLVDDGDSKVLITPGMDVSTIEWE